MQNRMAIGIFTVVAVFVIASKAVSQERNGYVAIKPLATLYGENSKIAEPKFLRITTEKEWTKVWYEHKYGSPDIPHSDKTQTEFDFDKVMVVAVFGGKVGFNSGYYLDSAFEDRKRITLRIPGLGYQLGPNPDGAAVERACRSQPWGVFVLPRSDKEIVLERDDRGRLDMPAKWVKWKTIPALSRQ
jgi:hypothetical protein